MGRRPSRRGGGAGDAVGGRGGRADRRVRQARGSLGRQDYAAGLAALDAAAAIDGSNQAIDYLRAQVLAAAGRGEEAIAVLTRLDAAGSLLVPQVHDFPGLGGPEFDGLVAAARAAAGVGERPRVHSGRSRADPRGHRPRSEYRHVLRR
ncbi:tetratricopeptide repeat protein [Nannocystis pusilla]|uniref:tetratricopeptide repeat protein n=1 Tax=Nannocystis pusilla TaxID=889268 RepID=UPI003B822AFF